MDTKKIRDLVPDFNYYQHFEDEQFKQTIHPS